FPSAPGPQDTPWKPKVTELSVSTRAKRVASDLALIEPEMETSQVTTAAGLEQSHSYTVCVRVCVCVCVCVCVRESVYVCACECVAVVTWCSVLVGETRRGGCVSECGCFCDDTASSEIWRLSLCVCLQA